MALAPGGDDDFFGYYNSENSIHDDHAIIPAHQNIARIRGANLDLSEEPRLPEIPEISGKGKEIPHSPTTKSKNPKRNFSSLSGNFRNSRKSTRGEAYVDMMSIAQSQKTATYTRNSEKKSRKRKPSSSGKFQKLPERRKGKKRRSSKSGSRSSSSFPFTETSSGSQDISESSGKGEESDNLSETSSFPKTSPGIPEAPFPEPSQRRSQSFAERRISEGSQGDDSEHSCGGNRGKPPGKFLANKIIEQERRRVLDLIQAQEECFACMWARRDYDKVDQADVDILENFFRNRYAKMNRKAFCAVMEKLYRVNIQEPYAKRGLKLPDWSKEMIEEHILYHELDPEIVFTEVLHTFFTTFMEMQNSFFFEKKIMVKATDPEEIDPTTGGPLEYEYEITKWVPDTRNIRCGIEVAKALREFFKLSNSEFAPERKRTRVKNMSPSLVTAERVRFKE
jgi:hypothetical protein